MPRIINRTDCAECFEPICRGEMAYHCEGCGQTMCEACHIISNGVCADCKRKESKMKHQEIKSEIMAEIGINRNTGYYLSGSSQNDGVHVFEFEDAGAQIKKFQIIVAEEDCE